MNDYFNKEDDKGFVDFEGNFLSLVTFIGAIIAFVGLVVNVINGLAIALYIVPLIAIIFYLSIFYLNKNPRLRSTLKWIVSIGTLIIINLLWYYNYGFRGPAPYFFVIIFSIYIYVWHNKDLAIATGIIVVNVLILFYLDYVHPELTNEYPNIHSKVIDIYFGVFFYIGLIFLVIFKAKNAYVGEYRKAKEAEGLKSAFLANMSHEIRTPLNAIVGFSNLITEGDLTNNERLGYKALVEENSANLLQLINDILDISKIESRQLNLKITKVDLNAELSNIYNLFKLTHNKENMEHIEFSLNKYKENFTIETDGVRVMQIVTNLLNNAFKFTEKGEINITLNVSNQNIIIKVQDTGIGIATDKIDKIFDRFYRIDNKIVKSNGKELYRGTGLGLYLSKNLANLLGGDLWVISEIGVGSTFYFSLPLNNYTVFKEEKKEIVSAEKVFQRYSKLKVMVVEDDDFNGKYFVELFKRFHIKITLATTGEEAIEILRDNINFDLLFLDIMLPGIDGFEVLKQSKLMNCPATIIAQTANAMEGDELKCLNSGFDIYISKPIKKAIIKKILDDYIESKSH